MVLLALGRVHDVIRAITTQLIKENKLAMEFKSIEDYREYISNLTLEQLLDIKHHINRKKLPDRYQLILDEIEIKKSDQNEIDKKSEKIDTESEEIPIYPQKPLPMLQIIKRAASIVWNDKFNLLRALVIPYIMMILIENFLPHIVVKLGIVTGLVIGVLKSLVYAQFVVSCHRLILLGGNSIPKFGIIIPRKREFRYWGWTLGFGFIIAIGGAILIYLLDFIGVDHKGIGIILVCIPVFYVIARWTLILPAVAVDQRASLKWAWEQSKSNGFRILALLAIPVIPIYGLITLITDDSPFILSGLVMLLRFILTVIGIIYISLTYKELCLQDGHNGTRQELTD